jgi:signal transduction histidine kinase
VDSLEILRRAVDFKPASPSTLTELSGKMQRVPYPAGSVIFSQGEDSRAAFLVESGIVTLTSMTTARERGVVADMEPGTLVGEMTALTGRSRTSTATARTDATLWLIPREALIRAVRRDAALATGIMVTTMDLVIQKDTDAILRKHQATELLQAFELERETSRRLRERDQLKNEQVAMVAHDLRSPLSVIVACADLLSGRWHEFADAQIKEFIDAITRNAKGLVDVVEDALQAALIESGELKYDIKPFDIARLASRVVDDLCRADSDLKIDFVSSPDLPAALGDEQRHWQILLNLLSNAIKFSEPGELIKVEASAEQGEILVQIKDRGIGIASHEMPKLFKKFSRLEPRDPALHPKGTGLGLYICKAMVEAQGGRIWGQSVPAEGSTFSYTLPLASDK